MSDDILSPIPDIRPEEKPKKPEEKPPPPEYVLPKYRSKHYTKYKIGRLPGIHVVRSSDGFSILFVDKDREIITRITGFKRIASANTTLREMLEMLEADRPDKPGGLFKSSSRASLKPEILPGASVKITKGSLRAATGVVIRPSSTQKESWVVSMRSGMRRGEEVIIREEHMKVVHLPR